MVGDDGPNSGFSIWRRHGVKPRIANYPRRKIVFYYSSWRISRLSNQRLQETSVGTYNAKGGFTISDVYDNFETIKIIKIMVGTGIAWMTIITFYIVYFRCTSGCKTLSDRLEKGDFKSKF